MEEQRMNFTHNGIRTKWNSFWSVIIQVINKIGRPRLTVLDDTKSRYQLIITVCNFRKKKGKTNTLRAVAVETMSKVKNFLQFGKTQYFFQDK